VKQQEMPRKADDRLFVNVNFIFCIKKMTKYYKILRDDLTHFGFTYKLGLNVDILSFDPTGNCRPGGLCYTDLEHIVLYVKYGKNIAEVEPVGQKYEEKDRWKTDKLFIHSITPLQEWFKIQSEEMKLAAVTQNGMVIKFIENQTREIQLTAVNETPIAISYIENPTEDVQMTAVTKCGIAITGIKNPTEEVQLAAVRQNVFSIVSIENPSEEM
jgi:hypothetical protein